MPTALHRINQYLEKVLEQREELEVIDALSPSMETLAPRVSGAARITARAVERRWGLLDVHKEAMDTLLDGETRSHMEDYRHNIENFIGTVKVPVGLAGPLRVRGLHAQGDYYVPLATTEAALVASYTRGAQAITESGGCTAAVVNEGVARAPAFTFPNLIAAGQFVRWVGEHTAELTEAAATTTRHGKLVDIGVHLEGNHVYLVCEYTTGDASGQNMVTIATHAVCRYILEHTPVKPVDWYVESNLSGDKKASHLSFQSVRGKKVTAEVVLSAKTLRERLNVTAQSMLKYYQISATGGVMGGHIGLQGHYANGLAAIYLACGQDAACVAESAVGITRFEPAPQGGLYSAVTLPNIMVGTVGGGTGLPSQRVGLQILGLAGDGQAQAFGEVVAGLLLAGELSIIAALATDEFTAAHARLARAKVPTADPNGNGSGHG